MNRFYNLKSENSNTDWLFYDPFLVNSISTGVIVKVDGAG